MKKLLSLLAAALLLPAVASADVLKNVTFTGEIQTIGSTAHHTVDRGAFADYQYNKGVANRVLAGLSADLTEDVTANLMFQYVNPWGNDIYAGQSVQGYLNKVRLVEANVVLHNLFCNLEVTVGRQFYGDEDSAVMYFGPNHYNAEYMDYARALDAVKLVYADDNWTGTVIAGEINDWSFDTNGFKATFYGADVKVNLAESLTGQLYGYGVQNRHDKLYYDGDSFQGFYGAKLNFAPEAFRFGVEYARDMAGTRPLREHADTGYMVKTDVAADMQALTVRGTFLYSKNFLFGYGNYVPGLLMQPFFTQNRHTEENVYQYAYEEGTRMFNVGMDYRVADKWTVSLDGYSFQGRTGSHKATLEADLTVKYAHNEHVELFAGVGYAKYGRIRK